MAGPKKRVRSCLSIFKTGHDDIRSVLPRFEWILKNPDVHLGMDPEFNLIASGKKPGTKIGTYDAADINYASAYLKDLVKKYNLPPKVFTVHRFTAKASPIQNLLSCAPKCSWSCIWMAGCSLAEA